jgi:hypothetical protein
VIDQVCDEYRRGARGPSRLTARDAVIVLALLIVGVGLPAALALSSHVFAVPRNDDWAYRRDLFDFVRTGHFSLVGWGAMTLVGQVLWAAAFVAVLGSQSWVPGMAVAVASVVGLTAAYLFARSLLSRAWAAGCVLLVLAAPGFLLNTSSFMTDAPAFSAETLCLALGLAALRRPDRRAHWLFVVASMGAGAFGFAIREFDVVAPVAVLLALAVQDRRHIRRYALAGAVVFIVCAAVYLWTATLPGAQHKPVGLPTTQSLEALGGAYLTLSLLVSPLLPLALRRAARSGLWKGLPAGAAAVALGVLLADGHRPILIGNYLARQGVGAGDVLFGARPHLFPGATWAALDLLAVVSGAGLAFVVGAAATERLRAGPRSELRTRRGAVGPAGLAGQGVGAGPRDLVRLFTLCGAVVLAGFELFVRAAVWDRDLWPLVFGAAVLLADLGARPVEGARHMDRSRVGRWRALVAALALVDAVVAGAVTLNGDAYDAARWSAGQDAVKAGFAPTMVDAGFEWVGSHASTVARPGRQVAGSPPYEKWYDQMFPGFRECAFVSGAVLDEPTLALLREVAYNEVGFAIREHLYIYALRLPGCPSEPRAQGQGSRSVN